jgi:holo-[acyl-carrier protein] synthase
MPPTRPSDPSHLRRSLDIRDVQAEAGWVLGTDLVEVAQVARSVETFGERYLHRLYTAGELAYCMSQRTGQAAHLAARFAAKEATLKALRQGNEATDWRSVEVRRRPDGSCAILLHGGARTLAERRGVEGLRVSMSHDGEYAVAVVVGERRPREGRRTHIRRTSPRGAYER